MYTTSTGQQHVPQQRHKKKTENKRRISRYQQHNHNNGHPTHNRR